jgi:predicted lipid-binding transport protein (Tim44 family)
MNQGSDWIEVLLFAAIAAFVGWRLYKVLGQRTGEERPPVRDLFGKVSPAEVGPLPRTPQDAPSMREVDIPGHLSPPIKEGLQAIAQADSYFTPEGFMTGAKSAYGLILEAFWSGDLASLKPLVSDDVYEMFSKAVHARESEGLTLKNQLIAVDKVDIVGAVMEGTMAEVTLRFDAQISSASYKNNALVSGETHTPLVVHDIWTFRRHTRSNDPNWLLVETDEEA